MRRAFHGGRITVIYTMAHRLSVRAASDGHASIYISDPHDEVGRRDLHLVLEPATLVRLARALGPAMTAALAAEAKRDAA